MNDNDPRLDVLALDRHDGRLSDGGLLSNLDYVDQSRGIVRVDTRDEALRNRLIAVIEVSECVEKPAHDRGDSWGLCAICEADAILAALREESLKSGAPGVSQGVSSNTAAGSYGDSDTRNKTGGGDR